MTETVLVCCRKIFLGGLSWDTTVGACCLLFIVCNKLVVTSQHESSEFLLVYSTCDDGSVMMKHSHWLMMICFNVSSKKYWTDLEPLSVLCCVRNNGTVCVLLSDCETSKYSHVFVTTSTRTWFSMFTMALLKWRHASGITPWSNFIHYTHRRFESVMQHTQVCWSNNFG